MSKLQIVLISCVLMCCVFDLTTAGKYINDDKIKFVRIC